MLKGMSGIASLMVLVSALIVALVWRSDLVLLWKVVLTLWLCAFAVLLSFFEGFIKRIE